MEEGGKRSEGWRRRGRSGGETRKEGGETGIIEGERGDGKDRIDETTKRREATRR